MAVIYLRSTDGDNADTGATWALAKATLAGAYAAMAAGDTCHVSQDHAETQGAAMTLTSPGTPAAPCIVLCGNDAAQPPTALAATATITTTGTYAITMAGSAYFHGITFNNGTGTGNVSFFIGSGAVTSNFVFSSCVLANLATGTAGRIYLGGSTRDIFIYAINSTLKLGHASQRVFCRGWINWVGGSYDASVAVPTGLFNTEPAYGCEAVFQGMDLSAVSTALVIAGNNDLMRYYFRNCKLHATVTAKTATAIIGPGAGQVIIDISDSGDTNYKINHVKYQGSIIQETTIKRTAGASDGTTAFCWKMVSLTTPQFFWPLESPPIAIWNETVGSARTLTVEIVHDSVTALKDDEVWVEVEHLGTSGVPLSLLATDRKADILAAGADQAASAEAWTTTGLTNPNTQKLVATFTPQEKGPFAVKVMLAKAEYTVYVCPKVTVA